MTKEINDEKWPENYFENVLGSWGGELKRPPQNPYEEREGFPHETEEKS